MKKMLFVINNMEIGGIQKSLVNLLEAIKKEYDISLVIFAPKGKLMESLPNNIKIVPINPLLQVLGISQKQAYGRGIKIVLLQTFGAVWSRIFGNQRIINWLVKKEKISEYYDYAISYSQFPPLKYFIGGTNEFVLDSVNAKTKIAFIHSDFQNCGGNSKYAREKYKLFDKIALCSKSAQHSFLQIMPMLKEKTYVVKNFNSYEKIKKFAFDNTVKYKKNIFNVISISRLSIEKGIDRGIKAVAHCLKQGIKVNYHIIGSGPDKKRLMDIVNEYEIKENIFFYGETDNPYRFLPNADLLLFPSIHEAAGLVIEEAASLGVPVLASETIASKEMVLDNDFGWVSKNNQKEFNFNLEFLLRNKSVIDNKKETMQNKIFNNELNIEELKNFIDEDI